MKIWLQSGSGLSANGGTPNSRLYEDAVARRLEGVARAGTDCVVFGIGSTPFGKDRYHAAKQKVFTGLIESVLRAEPEGYDAVGSSTLLITGITSCGSYSAFRLFSSPKAHFISPANWRRHLLSSVTIGKSSYRQRNSQITPASHSACRRGEPQPHL